MAVRIGGRQHWLWRVLTAFTRIWNHFRPRRRSFTAPEYWAALQERFAVWRIAAELRP
jgi:hypothetical protein